jgi:polyphosphate kinase
LSAAELFLNRELSWLRFNERVLEQASDPQNPLLERLKFLAIFSTNLDEFMMVRYAGLKEQVAAGVQTLTPDGRTPQQQILEVSRLLHELIPRHRRVLRKEVLPELARAGVRIEPLAELTGDDARCVSDFFEQELFPVLTPLAVDAGHPFPHLPNLSFSLLVKLGSAGQEARIAIIQVPGVLPRFLRLPGAGYRFVLLEEIIASRIARLFPGYELLGSHGFRVTRDADLELAEEADDLIRLVEDGVRRRHWADAVRLEVDEAMPDRWVAYLQAALRLQDEDVFRISSHLNVAAFQELAELPLPDLRDPPLRALPPAGFRSGESWFDAIGRDDLLLHHPFHTFDALLGLIREAAADPQVLAIKQTLYRVGSDSPVVDELMRAAGHGKLVTVLVELQARFDEEKNIGWAKELERAGVHVVYGVSGLKTHAKLLLIVRREQLEDGSSVIRRYVHLGTGNYNPVTSTVYTDLALLTRADRIGADVSDLFNYLTGYSKQREWRCLWVAPQMLRSELLAAIAFEAAEARAGRPALIQAKLNALVDPQVITALYEASRAGVRIDLLVRGICCLRPGVPGVSENITVKSIVGRFLEHSRILRFQRAGSELLLIGSADLMPRNLDNRVEALVPVTAPQLRRELIELLDCWFSDTARARKLLPDGTYQRVSGAAGLPPVDAQLELAERYRRSGAERSAQA